MILFLTNVCLFRAVYPKKVGITQWDPIKSYYAQGDVEIYGHRSWHWYLYATEVFRMISSRALDFLNAGQQMHKFNL